MGRFSGVEDGKALLRSLVQTSKTGVENIESATGWELADLLLELYLALQLSDRGITHDPHYNFSGICLTCPQQDNRGTLLTGPSSIQIQNLPQSDQLNSPACLFFTVDGKDILKWKNQILMKGAPGMNPAGAVVRLQ